MKFHFTRTVLKDIGIGAVVDGKWRIESYSHTGKNAMAYRIDQFARPCAPFTRAMLIHTDSDRSHGTGAGNQ